VACGLAPAALAQTYITFSVSGSHFSTWPTSINLSGAVTGYWTPDNNLYLGFVRDSGGTITTFNVGNGPTFPYGINNKGSITGYAGDTGSGFVRAPNGTITLFHAEGGFTVPQAINAGGTIAGSYHTSNGPSHGFVRHPNGLITSFDPPGSTQTYPTSINEGGAVAGYYLDSTGQHGFVRESGGKISSFDVPASRTTQVTGINVHGAITGWYSPLNANKYNGFVRDREGHFTSFDPAQFTGPYGINADGTVTGDMIGQTRDGFVRTPDGTITVFTHVPCSVPAPQPRSINDLGVITGSCFTTETSFGNIFNYYLAFVRLP
jgi:hypothetical protein